MCCFSQKTEVHDTSIFARLSASGVEQLVYQMQYAAEVPVAMILPLPVALPASEASVTWKDLKEYPSFFTDCANGFPEPPPKTLFPTKSAAAVAAAPLPVHEVGDYIASFVPNVNDFDRLDPRFSIKKEIWAQIPGYADYGFAVFQLKELKGAPHPIAFEFKTRLRDTVFFPTVHIHDGTVHRQENFDHALYVQDAAFDARVSSYGGPRNIDAATGLVRSQEKASTFFSDLGKAAGIVDGALLLHKMTIKGLHENTDTLVSLAVRARAPGCGRCDTTGAVSDARGASGAAASLGIAGLAWIIRRRNERSGGGRTD